MALKKKKVLKEDWKSTANTVADIGQIGLDVVGAVGDLTPGAGIAADLANAAIYAIRGKYLYAGLSLISTIPAIGDVIGKGTKFTAWFAKNMPKTAATVAKFGPDAVKGIRAAKNAINQSTPLIRSLFSTIQRQAQTNQDAAKLVPYLPQIWAALDAFTKSADPGQSQQTQPAQPQVAAEGLFLPSMTSMLFEDHDISDVIEKAAKTKNKSEKTNLLKKYHLMRNDGDQEPINVGEPGDTTTGDHLFNSVLEAQKADPKRRSWMTQSANQKTGAGTHQDKRKKRNKNKSEFNKKQISKQLVGESHVISGGISSDEAKKLAVELDLNFNKESFDFSDFLKGANHEIEHAKTVDKSPSTIARIAVDHLREDSKYYDKLMKIEAFAPKLKDFL